eukprot:209142_1
MNKRKTRLTRIDLNTFKQDDQMVGLGCDNESYVECQAMMRLFVTLKYYSLLDVYNNKDDACMFENFLNEIYPAFIDDYVHFINHHSHELENIYVELESMLTCAVSKCLFTSRHVSSNFRDKDEQNMDAKIKFYSKIINSLHFYLFHCFDVGLRTRECDTEQKDEDYIYFKNIQETAYVTKDFDRFAVIKDTFMIHESEIKNDEDDRTTLDRLYEYLKNKRSPDIDVIKLKTIIQQEEYDSESITLDTELIFGNMLSFQLNYELIENIYHFMNTQGSKTFHLGVRLYYWNYYKLLRQIFDEQQEDYNINDHGGYEIANLFVVSKYSSFKEEILNYIHFPFQQYHEVNVKVTEYTKTKIVKATEAISCALNYPYKIDQGESLTYAHILSMVLYTDYSELCTDFSSTFRQKHSETLESMKRRNSKYYWFSKKLRECVECYGQCRVDGKRWGNDELSGPFFCATSVVMTISSFNLRLNGPLSTSMHIEVAVKFSNRNRGSVMQLDNPLTLQYQRLCGFNLSWISGYPEEGERLFFGGYYFIKLTSIRHFGTMHIVYYLDVMLTGGALLGGNGKQMTVEKQDIQLLKDLFTTVLGNTKPAVDHYIFTTFESFTQNKQQIVLNLPELINANNNITDLIMHSLQKRDVINDKNDMTNLLRAETFEIFPNVKTLIIQTSSPKISCAVSLNELLLLLQQTKVEKAIVKAVTDDNTGNNWLHSLWNSQWIALKETYEENNYVISIKDVVQSESDEYWLVIKKDMVDCSQALNMYLDTIAADQKELKDSNQLAAYNFGVQFSYWKNDNELLYCKAKHKNLKEELLSNDICAISAKDWNNISNVAKKLHEEIMDWFCAKYIPNKNEYYGIKYGTKISLNHLIAILLCNDSLQLLPKIKTVCILNKAETINDLKTRHCEYVNLLKLLTEAITFYGTNLSHEDDVVYHFLTKKVYFNQFKCSFNVPLAATSNLNQGKILKHGGIILELGALKSYNGWTSSYFDLTAISEELTSIAKKDQYSKLIFTNKYLFFGAELEVKYVHTAEHKYNLAPLSLYESIVNGDMIFGLPHIPKDELFTKNKQYGFEMLRMCIDKNKTKRIDKTEINSKIFHEQLREKFLGKIEEKTDELVEAEKFVWHPTKVELNEFITHEKYCIVSQTMQTLDGSKFYCEMNVREHKAKKYGVISLNLFQLLNNQNEMVISCQFYSKQINEFYVRFTDVLLKLTENDNDAKQIAFFEWKDLEFAIRKRQQLEWNVVIVHHGKKRTIVQKVKNDNSIQQMMGKHNSEIKKINCEINKNLVSKYLPLHQFDHKQVSIIMKQWIMNDINFKQNLRKTMKIFSDCSLSGEQILSLSMNNIERILGKELLSFTTKKTFDIMLRKIQYWKTTDDENINTETPEKIGYMVYKYPLAKLLERINNKNDFISGAKFIEYYQRKKPWIKNVTGWNQTNIYQIESVLFKHNSYASSEIKEKMDAILIKRVGDSLGTKIKMSICDDYNVEEINYKMTNGGEMLEEFTNTMNDTIDTLIQENKESDDCNKLVKTI